MRAQDLLHLPPRARIERESARRGARAFVAGCVALLDGRDADPDLILVLGGAPARAVVTDRNPAQMYWVRVWAARGLLWEWSDRALPTIVAATRDDAWRVREMALKVIARHRLGDAIEAVAERQRDPVARVRAAAARALVRVVDTRA